jgi:hypothetical protein
LTCPRRASVPLRTNATLYSRMSVSGGIGVWHESLSISYARADGSIGTRLARRLQVRTLEDS